jgi:hypothetical protein
MGKLPLPLAVCKDTSRTFSTYGTVRKVQGRPGSRRFWKYDVIHVHIKTDSREEASKQAKQASESQTSVTLPCRVVYVNILCCVVLL